MIIGPVREEGPSQIHGGGSESAATDTEEQSDDNAENVFGAIAQRAQVVRRRRGGKGEERKTQRAALEASIVELFLFDEHGVDVGGVDLADLGEDGDESRGGGRGTGGRGLPEGERVGGDEEGLAGPCGDGENGDREEEDDDEVALTR
ncbi:hypothetical protein FNV43_RR13931 [Rhamnella rubrinervis]|uniref:Uncharacterized protein n=1 Tax=Rhamnella rubrinervis TaxID=2594499 RepID=A0A8K0H1X0_9ROSA|nr:hypothetical protein FNV43_RR13931 [Rhamnella rubrinervis]